MCCLRCLPDGTREGRIALRMGLHWLILCAIADKKPLSSTAIAVNNMLKSIKGFLGFVANSSVNGSTRISAQYTFLLQWLTFNNGRKVQLKDS